MHCKHCEHCEHNELCEHCDHCDKNEHGSDADVEVARALGPVCTKVVQDSGDNGAPLLLILLLGNFLLKQLL